MEKGKRFILIDGHAILHRAFHALPPLTTSKGEEVGAIFGFCSMLLRVIQDLKPEYLAVAFDLPKPTFRQKLYADYQAQRPEMAQELSLQVAILHQVLERMGIPIFEKEEYEADDVIGTLAVQAAARGPVGLHPRPMSLPAGTRRGATLGLSSGRRPAPATPRLKGNLHYPQEMEVVIVSGDRDMLQLVGEKVKVLAPVVGITKMVLYDEEAVEEKYGLKPTQWVDFKALVGDPSDNYPGVSGIGPKGATDLLKKFGTLKNIYQNLGKLPEKQARVLREGRKQVKLAKQLAKIATDAPVEFNLEDCKLKDLKDPQVEKLFRELEFKSLWERIEKNNNLGKKEKGGNDQLSLLN